MSTTSKKIKYGKVAVEPGTFDRKHMKLRVTMMIDMDIVDAYKAAASKRGIGYQTLMNEKLRESLEGLDKSLADRVAALERKMAGKRRS